MIGGTCSHCAEVVLQRSAEASFGDVELPVRPDSSPRGLFRPVANTVSDAAAALAGKRERSQQQNSVRILEPASETDPW